MELKYISKGQMPPSNKYVLIYLPRSPWFDSHDKYGVHWKVAKCVYGITMEERKVLLSSDRFSDYDRGLRFYPEDEHANNKTPYYFREFGPSQWFGQEVDVWCELPKISEE